MIIRIQISPISLIPLIALVGGCSAVVCGPGDWPMTRHDPSLAGRQTLTGAMTKAPVVLARYATPKTPADLTPVDLDRDGRTDLVLGFRGGGLRAYSLDGRRLWEAPARGITFTRFVAAADLDADGKMELVLEAGNPGFHAPAAAVLDAASGGVRAKLPFAAGAFGWRFHVGPFVPGVAGEQLLVVNSMQVKVQMDASQIVKGGKGAAVLWSFEEGAGRPRERWFHDIGGFNLMYPTTFVPDLDGPSTPRQARGLENDGRPELLIVSWCSIYLIDLATGGLLQHFEWDPQGANKRHYGWDQLLDVDGDGDLDLLIVSGTKHVDVLRNDGGKLVLAWTAGWPDQVTISALEMAHAPWPAGDVDGDGKPEVVFSLFNEGGSGRWALRVLDARTGKASAVAEDLIPRGLVDLDGDGDQEILATRHRTLNRDAWEAVEVLDWKNGGLVRRGIEGATGLSLRPLQVPAGTVVLSSGGAYAPFEVVNEKLPSGGARIWLRFGEKSRAMTLGPGGAMIFEDAPEPIAVREADLSRIPADGGPPPNPVLAADLNGNGIHEIILAGNPVKILEWSRGKLTEVGELPAECVPVVCDLDGDGTLEIVVGDRDADRNLRVNVLDARTRQARWRRSLPGSQMCGLTFGLVPLYVAVGRFTGKPGRDVYAFTNKPGYRATMLDGRDGTPVWTKDGTMPGTTVNPEGYGPSHGFCSVLDVDGDGAEDLLFTSPSYLAGISGRDAAYVRTPKFMAEALGAWGGYGSPVLCAQPDGPPVVQIMNAWSITGAVPLGAKGPDWPAPLWSERLDPAEWRTGSEAVFRDSTRPGRWCVVWPDHGGRLNCREVETGKPRWTRPLGGLTPAPAVGDVDGDGRDEIVIAGSDGRLVALRDAGDHPEVVWEMELGAPLGPPLLADVTGDGRIDVIVATADGVLYVLGVGAGKWSRRIR